MSSNTNEHLCIGRDLCFVVVDGKAVIVTHAGDNVMTLDDLGGIAEWLAVAWENVAGEEYKPVSISERGYVTDLGIELGIASADLSDFADTVERLERDCE